MAVSITTIRAVNDTLAKSQPITAVFTGGTSGIGHYTLRSLVKHHGPDGPGIRIYIVGRNAVAAAQIIAECTGVCPSGEYRFVKASDLALLTDVDACSREIARHEQELGAKGGLPRVDLLVMTHGDLPWTGRRETSEGLETFMSLLYYSRMRFITNLMPLLRASALPAHVVTVYAGGMEKMSDWDPTDLMLQRPGRFSLAVARTHVIVMTALFTEYLASENPAKLSISHVFPGLVITPGFYLTTNPWWFKIVVFFLAPIMKLTFCVSPEDSGDKTLFFASERFPARGGLPHGQSKVGPPGQELDVAQGTDGKIGSGAYSCKHTGEACSVSHLYEELRAHKVDQTVLDHTLAVFRAIEAGQPFKDS